MPKKLDTVTDAIVRGAYEATLYLLVEAARLRKHKPHDACLKLLDAIQKTWPQIAEEVEKSAGTTEADERDAERLRADYFKTN